VRLRILFKEVSSLSFDLVPLRPCPFFDSLLSKPFPFYLHPFFIMAAARTARVPTIKEKTRQSVAEDDQRTDGQSIWEVDLDKWIPPPISWGYENLVQGAVKRFEEFLELMGPRDPRSQPR
jgi:hypothetical protein